MSIGHYEVPGTQCMLQRVVSNGGTIECHESLAASWGAIHD
jgi:hypothetical protein